MKKIFMILSIILVGIFSFTSCNYSLNKKPNNFYYTNLLAQNLTLASPKKCIIEECNFHDEEELGEKSISDIKNMLKVLKKNNFMNRPKDLPAKISYKITFTFNKEKLLINVYNEKYLSIYPWDGNYPMDYINMDKVPISLNPYYLGKYIFKNY